MHLFLQFICKWHGSSGGNKGNVPMVKPEQQSLNCLALDESLRQDMGIISNNAEMRHYAKQ